MNISEQGPLKRKTDTEKVNLNKDAFVVEARDLARKILEASRASTTIESMDLYSISEELSKLLLSVANTPGIRDSANFVRDMLIKEVGNLAGEGGPAPLASPSQILSKSFDLALVEYNKARSQKS
jgi:hypothetical protein